MVIRQNHPSLTWWIHPSLSLKRDFSLGKTCLKSWLATHHSPIKWQCTVCGPSPIVCIFLHKPKTVVQQMFGKLLLRWSRFFWRWGVQCWGEHRINQQIISLKFIWKQHVFIHHVFIMYHYVIYPSYVHIHILIIIYIYIHIWVCLKILYPYTQWFCWSWSLLNGYFIGGIPHFQTYPYIKSLRKRDQRCAALYRSAAKRSQCGPYECPPVRGWFIDPMNTVCCISTIIIQHS